MSLTSSEIDVVRTPAVLWVAACAAGEAGGLEAASAVGAAVQQGMLAGPGAVAWLIAAGLFEGLVLACCLWAGMRRMGMSPRFVPFALATMTATTLALLIMEGAHAAWSDAAPRLALAMGVGVMGGALVGAVQAIPLVRRGLRPIPWIAGWAIGWALAAGVSDTLWGLLPLTGAVGVAALAGAGAGLAGGALLGFATLRPVLEMRLRAARA